MNDQRLHQGRYCHRLPQGGHGIADPHLNGTETRVWTNIPPDLANALDPPGPDQRANQLLEILPALMPVRQAGGGKGLENLAAAGGQAGVLSLPERRAGAQRQQVGKPGLKVVGDLDGRFRIRDADMHMQAKDQHAPRRPLHLVHKAVIALILTDTLFLPERERMGSCTQQAKPETAGAVPHPVELATEVGRNLCNVGAHIGVDLDGRLEQFFLEPVHLAKRMEDLRCRRCKRPGFPVNQLELHLDTDC